LPAAPKGLGKVLLRLLGSPGIASKRWVYEQYDHEVGVRTVTKPGRGDAAVMRLPNGNFLAIKADGNSKATYLDPYSGAAGAVSEACRNVVAVGAEPMAMVDHLQVGDPEDPGVFWTFSEMIRGMADYCKGTGLPVVGGKVSFYNEDQSTKRAIKPSPVALVVGLVEGMAQPVHPDFKRDGERIVIVGETLRELGGSDYYERIHEFTGGAAPGVNPARDRTLFESIHRLMRRGWITAAHDCSSGGIAAALAEMCIWGATGATVEADRIPSSAMAFDELLFSESHGRLILTAPSNDAVKLVEELSRARIPRSVVGEVGGTKLRISSRSKGVISVGVEEMSDSWARGLARVLGD
ncbi:MAG: phosphoribosylformylglycinamidine synthase subunit PurL, partial [Thaumarchaeota archaeon]|nr:phosphoribosylformylglycinamidine synthase subunit PurL [Nitrososphaerota archaeon]